MGSNTSLVRTYYHGKYAWPNYVLDVVEATESNASLQRESVHLAKVAQEQREELLRQTEGQREELSAIRSELHEVGDEIRLGVSLIVDRLDEQMQVFLQAVTRLEEIHRTLKIPRLTEANELYCQGEGWFRQGLFEESLDAYLKAEEIYKVHYLLQFRIGALFLEGRNTKSNVINLSQAEPHLLLATRYAEVQDSNDAEAQRICGDAYFRAGKAAYLIAEQRKREGDLEGLRACLRRALDHLEKSSRAAPQRSLTVYWQAKCHALLGEKLATLEKFSTLSDRNRKYWGIASQDGDFESLRDDIREIFVRALHSPGPTARTAQSHLQGALESLNWAQHSGPEPVQATRVSAIEKRLRVAAEQLPGLNADIESLLQELPRNRKELNDITQLTISKKIGLLQQQISDLTSQKKTYENEIESCRRKITQTEGSGALGCLGSVVFLFLLAFLVTILRPVLDAAMPNPPGGNVLFVNGMLLVTAIGGYVTGVKISKHYRNRQLREQLDAALGGFEEWNRAAPSALQIREAQVRELAEEMKQFGQWRNSNT